MIIKRQHVFTSDMMSDSLFIEGFGENNVCQFIINDGFCEIRTVRQAINLTNPSIIYSEQVIRILNQVINIYKPQ